MFCSQCGKKVMETMLFCPFCGSPIVIPEQDAEDVSGKPPVKGESAAPVQETAAPEPESAVVEEQAAEPSEAEEAAAPAIDLEDERVQRFIDNAPLNISINWETEDVVPEGAEDVEYEDITADFQDDEDDEDDDDEAFVPLDFEAFEQDGIDPIPEEDVSGEISELLSSQLNQQPESRKTGAAKRSRRTANVRQGGPNKNTYVPMKAFNPNDIFLDGEDDEDYEDYEDEDYDYEEPEYGGFFVRHIRGLVALALFIVVLAILAGWAFSDGGQLSLANANLAWRPSAYETLGYQAYQNGNYALSGSYYEKALDRDAMNYSYAYSAGIAYYMEGSVSRAAEMAKKAVEINPSKADAYHLLLRLYPDAVTRPWDISSMLQKGYQLTGDASLNVES